MICEKCIHWKHNPTDPQDRAMIELGYKPCKLDKTKGRYLSGQAKACENFQRQIPKAD
ncbi:MAG TPA: hypothetical protein VFM18_23990 [Methanosarcina sp.]|nr:hypothetical protein [Methanosarcina sp.]